MVFCPLIFLKFSQEANNKAPSIFWLALWLHEQYRRVACGAWYCKYIPIFVPLQPILNIQTKMRLRYAYVSVLLLMSFSTIANVWASSSLSPDGRAFSYAVSSDTVRESRALSEGDGDSVEKQKEDSIFNPHCSHSLCNSLISNIWIF